jgi:hypothetical protein
VGRSRLGTYTRARTSKRRHRDPAAYDIASAPPPEEIIYPAQPHLECRDEEGRLHRQDGPARILADGTVEWWWQGRRHRDDGPALITGDGVMYWLRGYKLHRHEGPAVVAPSGLAEYWRYGRLHRKDGPAVSSPGNGLREWWLEGDLVRSERSLTGGLGASTQDLKPSGID